MASKQNGAARHEDGGDGAINTFLTAPAAMGFLASQKLALEAARFWARRMRAYADQLDTLAGCADPMQFISAQARFVERMQEDYAAERRQVSDIIVAETPAGKPAEEPREARN